MVFGDGVRLRRPPLWLRIYRRIAVGNGSREYMRILAVVIMVLGVIWQASFQERDSLLQCIDVPDADQIIEYKMKSMLGSYKPLE
jgi:hypothetical protein